MPADRASAVTTSAATGPAAAPALACTDGMRAMVRDTLYLGRNRPDGGRVDDAEWQRFVDDVVVPRFPDGFTVVEASGHWRSGSGAIERERSMLLIVLHGGDPASSAAMAAVAAEYRQRFRQEAVLHERGPTCAGF
jgi:hypothetical protein